MDAKKVKIQIIRDEMDFKHKTAGKELTEAVKELMPFNNHGGLPLARENIIMEIDGVPTAVVNALRRTIHDELKGKCLTFDKNDFGRKETTDPFMADEDFIRTRIRMIPLRPQISESLIKNLKFNLDAQNQTSNTISVYSGDLTLGKGCKLSEPIFNPTHEIASLQPGKTLHIKNIHIVEGYGNQDAAFIVAHRAASIPLDIKEHPKEDTHKDTGEIALQSGYVESSLVANPRSHRLTACISAVPKGSNDTITVLIDACGYIMKRLRYIQGILENSRVGIESNQSAKSYRSANAYLIITPDTTFSNRIKGVLVVKNETDTIGNLITRSIYEIMPDIGYVGYSCIPHKKMMELTVSHSVAEPEEIEPIITKAVKHAYGIISKIQKQII